MLMTACGKCVLPGCLLAASTRTMWKQGNSSRLLERPRLNGYRFPEGLQVKSKTDSDPQCRDKAAEEDSSRNQKAIKNSRSFINKILWFCSKITFGILYDKEVVYKFSVPFYVQAVFDRLHAIMPNTWDL